MAHYEPGDYKARIVRQGFAESKNKNTPFFYLEIEPTESTGANALPEKIYRRTIDLYVTDKTIERVVETLRELGWNGTKLAELEPGSPNHFSLVDQEIDVYCKIEEGYDRFYLSRKSGAPASGPAEQKGVAAKLDKLFGKQLMSALPGKKAAPKPPAEPVAAVDDDDSIPF